MAKWVLSLVALRPAKRQAGPIFSVDLQAFAVKTARPTPIQINAKTAEGKLERQDSEVSALPLRPFANFVFKTPHPGSSVSYVVKKIIFTGRNKGHRVRIDCFPVPSVSSRLNPSIR